MKNYTNFGKGTAARTALNVVGLLLIVGLVAPFVVYSVPAVVGADESYVVLTGSMSPAIEPGDVVIVESVQASEIRKGDVITFRQNADQDVPVTHRVSKVTTTESGAIAFETWGDNNEDPDSGLVTEDLLVGRVMVTMPYVGRVIEFVNSPAGFVALVVVPVVLLILSEAYSFVATSRRSGGGDAASATRAGSDVISDGVPSPADGGDAPAATAEVAPHEDESTGGIVLTKNDFTFTAVSLLALVAYSGYMAYLLRDSLSIAVAVGAGAALLVALVVRLFAFREPGAPAAPDSAATDGGVEEFEFQEPEDSDRATAETASSDAQADVGDAEVTER